MNFDQNFLFQNKFSKLYKFWFSKYKIHNHLILLIVYEKVWELLTIYGFIQLFLE